MRSRRWDLPIQGLLFILGVTACWHAGVLSLPLHLDNQSYYYISERAASGVAPHVSQFDPKNALSMLLGACGIATGRLFGGDDLMSARAASVFVAGMTLPLLWRAGRKLTGSSLAAAAGALSLLAFKGYYYLAAMGARPKVFLVFFMAVVVSLAGTSRRWLLGLMAICCFLCWQPALTVLAVVLIGCALRGESRQQIFLVLAGSVAGWGLYEGYFLWHGALGEQLWQSLVFPASYSKGAGSPLDTLVRVFGGREQWEGGLGAQFVMVSLGCVLPLLWGVLVVERLRGNPLGRKAPQVNDGPNSDDRDYDDRYYDEPGKRHEVGDDVARAAMRWELALGGSAALAFLSVDYQGFPDRFFLMVYSALLLAWLVAVPARWLERKSPAVAVALVIAGIAGLFAFVATTRFPHPPYGLKAQRAAAAFVGELLEEGRSVYATGPPHLLALNRTDNYLPYGFFPYRVRAHFTARIAEEGPWLPLRDGELPDVVLRSRTMFMGNKAWLAKFYVRRRHPILDRQSVQLYERRRGSARPTHRGDGAPEE